MQENCAKTEKNIYDVLKNAFHDKYLKKGELQTLMNCFELAVIAITNEISSCSDDESITEYWSCESTPTFGGLIDRLGKILIHEEELSASLLKSQRLSIINAMLELRKQIEQFSFSTDFNLQDDFLLSKLIIEVFSPVVQLRNSYVHDSVEEIIELKEILEILFKEIIKMSKFFKFENSEKSKLIKQHDGKRIYLMSSSAKKDFYKGSDLSKIDLKKVMQNGNIHTNIKKDIFLKSEHTVKGIKFVAIPAGTISLKAYDTTDPVEHYISRFFLAKYPVSLAMFNEFLDENVVYAKNRIKESDLFLKGLRNLNDKKLEYYLNSAVFYISWHDAIEYCDWLNKKNGLTVSYKHGLGVSKQGFRLPTEYEWYYARWRYKKMGHFC